MSDHPRTFSSKNPNVRLVWDSLTLSSYMSDPLAYYWKHVRGWRESNTEGDAITLVFGLMYHEGVERLWNGEGIHATLRWLIAEAEARSYDDLWEDAPQSKKRGRRLRDLARCLVWYEIERSQPPQILGYELLAQEQYFSRQLGEWEGEPLYFVGRIDGIARSHDEPERTWAIERKTTNTTISSPHYWRQWRSSLQVWAYDWLLGGPDTMSGRVAVEACQTAVSFARFETEYLIRTPAQRAAMPGFLLHWINRATHAACQDEWYPNLSLRFPGDWAAQLATWPEQERESRLAQTGELTRTVWNPLTGSHSWDTQSGVIVTDDDTEEGTDGPSDP